MVYWILRNHKIIIDWSISGHVRCVSWVEFNNCLIRSTYTSTWTLRLCFCVNVMGQKVHWLLTCVLSNNMYITIIFLCKLHGAESTLVWLFSCVSSNMSITKLLCIKFHGAVSTMEGFFSCVSKNVLITFLLCIKRLRAEFAFVRFFSSVNMLSLNMLITTKFLFKLLGTERALKWFFYCVRLNMSTTTIFPF